MTTTIHITSVPEKALTVFATPFRIIVPKQLDREAALALFTALRENEAIKVQDPFWLQDVSCVFPATIFTESLDFGAALEDVRDAIADVVEELSSEFGDDIVIELDVPDSMTDAVVLDVTDLTQPS